MPNTSDSWRHVNTAKHESSPGMNQHQQERRNRTEWEGNRQITTIGGTRGKQRGNNRNQLIFTSTPRLTNSHTPISVYTVCVGVLISIGNRELLI